MINLIPPYWLIKLAIVLVWVYEGAYCKLFRGDPRQFEIVKLVPNYGQRYGVTFLIMIGSIEMFISIWVLSGREQVTCALVQTVLLFLLNINGILWSRKLIHDPAGMVVKNFAFLVLVWVGASFTK